MRFFYKMIAVMLCAAFWTLTPLCLSAAAAPAQTRARAAAARAEFSSFIDGFLAGAQKEQDIPGMAFVAVRDGEILYLNGYGFLDISGSIPVDPARTLFRAGQVSQAVTATAVLQLVDKGRLQLDEDVNLFLTRWRLPDGQGAPVTLRSILTHTAGFDDKAYETGAPTSADERAYAARLPKLMPKRGLEPGRFYSASDMGYTLAGSVVERYSRQSFAGAIKRYVFDPLGMTASTFALSDEAHANLAPGHSPDGTPIAYTYRYDMPSTGMLTTASDMGRFMLAALGEGAIGRNRILPSMYAGSMLRRHFSPHPAIDGTAFAYRERTLSGIRTLQISGNLPGYSSFMMLIPERNFGLFFAANTGGLAFEDELSRAVVRRFFPVSADAPPLRASTAMIPSDIAGYYRHISVSRHTSEKARHILRPQFHVFFHNDELVITRGDVTFRAVPTEEPDLFRFLNENELQSAAHAFFQRDASGDVRAMILRDVANTYERLPQWETWPSQILQAAVFAATALVSFLGLFLSIAINRNRLPWEKGMRPASELWTLSSLFCLIQGLFAAGLWIAWIIAGASYDFFVPYQVKALFLLPLAGGILLAWFWLRILVTLFNPDHYWAEKLLLAAIAGIETGFMLFLANWRLLGFMF